MDPLHPETPEGVTVPVRRGSGAAGNAPQPPHAEPTSPPSAELKPADTPLPDAKTVSFRPGAAPPAAPSPSPTPTSPEATVSLRGGAAAPAVPPAKSEPPALVLPTGRYSAEGATLAIRQKTAAAPAPERVNPAPAPRVELPPESPEPSGPSIVSIQQILRMRMLMEQTPTEKTSLAAEEPDTGQEEPRPPEISATVPAQQPAAPIPVAPVETAPLDPALLCPRCGDRLISPESLGMCPGCGYCRSLEEGKDKIPPPPEPKERRPSLFGMVEFIELLGWLPLWFWTLVASAGLVVVVTVFARREVSAHSAVLTWWGGVQFVAGVLLLIAAHVWALLRVAHDDEGIGPFDFVPYSPRIWRLVFRRLPATSWQILLAGWGFLLTGSALALGGIPFTGTGTGDTSPLQNAVAKIKPSEYRSIQENASSDLQSRPPPPEDPPVQRPRPEDRNKIQCTIIGYRTNAVGVPTEIILAREQGGSLRYAGVVQIGTAQGLGMLPRLRTVERQPPPSGVSNSNTFWLKAGTHCEVHTANSEGTLQGARFGRVLGSDD